MANNSTVVVPGALGLNVRPLLLLLGVALAVAAGVTVVLWWRGPNWSLLYGNLSDSDSSSVVQALQTGGIEYKLDNNSGAIMVPADKVYAMRMQLASKGIPQGDGVGFEIFDKPNFGISDFVQRANYLRALQGELARTIMHIQQVAWRTSRSRSPMRACSPRSSARPPRRSP